MTFGGVSDPELQFVYGTCDMTADGCFNAKRRFEFFLVSTCNIQVSSSY